MNKQKRKRNGTKKFIKFLHIVLISVKYLFKILQEIGRASCRERV